MSKKQIIPVEEALEKAAGVPGLVEAINKAAEAEDTVAVRIIKNEDGTYDVAVKKADVEERLEIPVMKSFGEVDEEQRYTLSVWYEPGKLDAHGEHTDAAEIEKAWHRYMETASPDIHLQHNPDIVAGRRQDGVVWPFEVTVPMTKADGTTTDYTFPAGTPFLGVKWEPWAWELVKAGEIRGYSIGGKSKRLEVDLPNPGV